MTNEERINELIQKIAERFPQTKGHEKHIRHAIQVVIDGLEKQDLKKPGAYTPDMYFDAIENNLDALASQFTP